MISGVFIVQLVRRVTGVTGQLNQEAICTRYVVSLITFPLSDDIITINQDYSWTETCILRLLSPCQFASGSAKASRSSLPLMNLWLPVCSWQVDIKNQGKTALQVAAHQGHMEVVKALLQANGSVEVKDEDGDTALHYTAFG